MNCYEQSTGRLFDEAGNLLGTGYSGGNCGKNPEGLNCSAYDMVPDIGPLPRGFYTIGAPEDSVTHGPYVLKLTPNEGNDMYGRSGFLVHGDSVVNAGKFAASEGCICIGRAARAVLWNSGDRDLRVVSGLTIADLDGEIAT